MQGQAQDAAYICVSFGHLLVAGQFGIAKQLIVAASNQLEQDLKLRFVIVDVRLRVAFCGSLNQSVAAATRNPLFPPGEILAPPDFNRTHEALLENNVRILAGEFYGNVRRHLMALRDGAGVHLGARTLTGKIFLRTQIRLGLVRITLLRFTCSGWALYGRYSRRTKRKRRFRWS